MFEGQHALRAEVFVYVFSKFLQREKDFDVGHALAVSLFQILRFLSCSFSYFFLHMPIAVNSREPERHFLAIS